MGYAQLEDKKQQLSRLEQQEENLNLELFSYNLLKDNYQNYDLEDLLVRLPEQGQLPEIILWIKELFSDPALSTPSLSFSVVSQDLQFLQVTLSFTGPYQNIYQLIDRIEGSDRVTKVDRLNLSRGQGNLSAGLVIKIYGQDFTDFSVEDFDFENSDLFRRQLY